MVNMRFVLLCIVIAVARSDDTVKVIVPPAPPFVPGNTTNSSTSLPPTTVTPNTTSTTPLTTKPATTTTPKPTITTPKPTTTTPKPTTTTPKPTTTTTKPTTTTTKPTTPSPPPPTTTTTPSPPTTIPPPVPEPSVGNWTVNYTNSNTECIVFDLAAQFEIPVRNSTVKLNLPDSAVASGTCDETVQNIQLKWKVAENVSNVLEFGFSLNNSKFELEAVVAVLNLTIPSSGPQVFNLSHVKPEFSTPVKNSYKCAKVQTLEMKESGSNQTVLLKISHVQFEAFTNVTGHTFSAAKDCEASVTSDVVPIVVGCVLAALVVMVLIAYLIGRRRCQARGYLSM